MSMTSTDTHARSLATFVQQHETRDRTRRALVVGFIGFLSGGVLIGVPLFWVGYAVAGRPWSALLIVPAVAALIIGVAGRLFMAAAELDDLPAPSAQPRAEAAERTAGSHRVEARVA